VSIWNQNFYPSMKFETPNIGIDDFIAFALGNQIFTKEIPLIIVNIQFIIFQPYHHPSHPFKMGIVVPNKSYPCERIVLSSRT
jgi:hypothetical protein